MESILLITLFVITFVVISVFFSRQRKDKDGNKKYDEMQLAIRAEGYKRGYITILILISILFIVNQLNIKTPFSTDFYLFTSAMISVVIYSIYAIEKDAFFAIGEKSIYYIFFVFIIVVFNAIAAISHIIDGTLISDGIIMCSNGGSNLICAISFFAILITYIHKYIKERLIYEKS